MRIELLAEVDSTNKYIERYLPYGEDVIVCAERQTGGMGTKGRTFSSEEGGVYLSILRFYEGLPADESFRIMQQAAVVVCRTAAGFGVRAEIKWPNDVLVNGKKLSGTLIKNGISEGFVTSSIVGIGLNVNNDVSALGGIAVTMSEAAGKNLSVQEVRERLISELLSPTDFSEYLSFARFLGREVTVCESGTASAIQEERSYLAHAKEILPDGRLVVEAEGETRTLSSAEIRIRL